MSDPENVFARWSRLKRERAQREKETPAAEPAGVSEPRALEQKGSTDAEPAAHDLPAPAFDPASLPPIESIVAGSDVRAFLQAGVPTALTRAALRRAWSTDPAIRDFIEIAENQWDFTNPSSIPGFGPITADDVQRVVAHAMGKIADGPTEIGKGYSEAGERSGAGLTSPQKTDLRAQEPDFASANRSGAQYKRSACEKIEEDIAPQQGSAAANVGAKPTRRGHGKALPQ